MFIIWMGVLNALRGFSFGDNPNYPPATKPQKVFNLLTSKGMFCIVGGYSMASYLGYYHELFAVCVVGLAFFAVKGWGTALSMTWPAPSKRPHEPENKLIDPIAMKLSKAELVKYRDSLGHFTSKKRFKTDAMAIRYALIWTSLRGLFILPLFLGLAYLANDPLVILFGIPCGLLMGPIYWLSGSLYARMKHKPRKYAGPTRIVEFIMGCNIGLWVVLV